MQSCPCLTSAEPVSMLQLLDCIVGMVSGQNLRRLVLSYTGLCAKLKAFLGVKASS